MPLYLEIIFTLTGHILSILGILLGAKALFSVHNKNIQKTKSGVNYQGDTYYGYTADEIIKIIKSLSREDVQKIKDEMTIKFDEIEKELSTIPKINASKDEPTHPKEGDIWFDTSNGENSK